MLSILTTGLALFLIKKAVETGRDELTVIEYRSTNFYYILWLVVTAVVLLKAF